MINILILESETAAASGLASTIRGWGCSVAGIVKDHQGAMHFCEKNKIDLFITETRIHSESDGIETAFIIQEIYHIPVIFTTVHIDKETLKKAAKVDFMAYLIKPYRENDLLVLIRLSIIKYHLVECEASRCCGYFYDIHLNKIYYDEDEIVLTAHEKLLFLLLFHKRGALSTHKEIDEVIWNDHFVSDEARRQLIHRLKMKLPHDSIEIVRGLGYKLK